MQILNSGFADVCVTLPETSESVYAEIRERVYFSPDQIIKSGYPYFTFEGECHIEKAHTISGMFYQRRDCQYVQMIYCSFGSAYVAVVDIRPESKTYRQSKLFFISADNGRGLIIPKGFAVGYMTESEHTVLMFKMDRKHNSQNELRISPFDSSLKIRWPAESVLVSAMDRYAPSFSDLEAIMSEDLHRSMYIDCKTLEESFEETANMGQQPAVEMR